MRSGSPGVPLVQASQSTTPRWARMTMLERITTMSMPAGSRSPAVRRWCSGSARVDIRRWLGRRAVQRPLSSPRRRGSINTEHSIFPRPCRIAKTRRMGPRLRGDDNRRGCRTSAASLLRRQNLDQLALAGVDLGMLVVPGDGHFLELDAELGVVVDHLAHLRARKRVQIGLPGVVGQLLAFLRHYEDRVELGGVGVLRVLGDREVVVAL